MSRSLGRKHTLLASSLRGTLTSSQATGLLLLAALAWGIGNVAQKTILEHLDAYTATGMSSLVGALVLLPLAMRERRAAPPMEKGSLWLLGAVSILFTFSITVMQISYGLTTVTNAGFLVNTSAVLTPILAWVCFGQRPPVAIWFASLIALNGAFLMAGTGWSVPNSGDLLALLSALGFAFWTLAVGLYAMRYRRPVLMTVVQLAVCGILCTGVSTGLNGLPAIASLGAALPEILFLGLVSKALAYVLTAIAQQHVPASCAAVLVSAEAIFGAMTAALVLGETLSWLGAIGSLCIIIGVIVAARIPIALPEPGYSAQGQHP